LNAVTTLTTEKRWVYGFTATGKESNNKVGIGFVERAGKGVVVLLCTLRFEFGRPRSCALYAGCVRLLFLLMLLLLRAVRLAIGEMLWLPGRQDHSR
jgi:hypothetical protein